MGKVGRRRRLSSKRRRLPTAPSALATPVPELPEVEVVRRGLDPYVTGRILGSVQVLNSRSVRRHEQGIPDFEDALRGRQITRVSRRGKFLWMPLDDGSALVVHLGMSGQVLLPAPQSPDGKHLRVRLTLEGADRQMLVLTCHAHVATMFHEAGGHVRSLSDPDATWGRRPAPAPKPAVTPPRVVEAAPVAEPTPVVIPALPLRAATPATDLWPAEAFFFGPQAAHQPVTIRHHQPRAAAPVKQPRRHAARPRRRY